MSKLRRIRCGTGANFRLLPRNVIQLDSFRSRRSRVPHHTLFYLQQQGTWRDLLTSFTCLQIEEIQTLTSLKAKLFSRPPGLVILDAGIDWAEPIELVRELHQHLGVPIVMVCHPEDTHCDALFLKQAYAAGVYETLSSSLPREEVFETLEVLLKFQKHLSLHE